MANKIHTDVAIIGGGIVGSAIAYYVSKAGIEATLIEKKDIASGTSSRCDGNITIVDKDPSFDNVMSIKSQELTVDLTKVLDLPFEYRKHGSILVCDNDDEMQAAVDWVKIHRENGLKFNVLEPKDIKEESPFLDRKSTRLNSSHVAISYAVFCLKKKNIKET